MAEYRVRFIADTREAINNIANMRKLVAGITREFENAEIGSEEFIRSASNLSRAKSELKDYLGEVVNIDRAFNQAEKALDDFARANDRMVNSAIKANDKYEQILRDRYELEDYFRKKAEREEAESFSRRLKQASATRARAEREQKILAEAPRSTLYDPAAIVSLERRLGVLREKARQIVPRTDEWNKVNAEARKLEQKMERINKIGAPGPSGRERLGAAGGAFLYGGGMGGGIGSMIGGVGGGMLAGNPGAFAGAAVGQAIDSTMRYLGQMAEQAASLRQLQRGLAMASIDAKDFAEAQKAVNEVSQRLLMPLEETTRYFAQLRANTKEYNISVAETAMIMEGTALAVSATGGSMDDLDGAMRAVVQIMSKGGVQAEELRGQLGERFPGAVVKFAAANKLSFEQLQDGLEKGEIGIKEFIEFAKKNYTDYAKFSEQLATAPEYAGRRLEKAMEQLNLAIGSILGESGATFQDFLTQGVLGIATFVKENESSLKSFFNTTAAIFTGIGKLVYKVASTIWGIWSRVLKGIQGIIATAKVGLNIGNVAETKAALTALDEKIEKRKGTVDNPRGDAGLKTRRDALQRRFEALGGEAAIAKAETLSKPDFIFGGPGAGMPLTREGKGDQADTVKKTNLESFEKLKDQLAKAYNEAEINRIKQRYELQKRLQQDAFDMQEMGANRLQRQNLSLMRGLVRAEQDRFETVQQAQMEVQKAAESVISSVAGTRTSPLAASDTGAYLQGNIGPTSTGPHFDVKRVGGGYFPRNYLDQYVQVNGRPLSAGTTVPGGTFAGHQRRGSHGWDYAFGDGRHAATLTGGAKWMEGAPTEHGERRRFQLPSGETFQFLHGKSEGIGAGLPRKVGSNEQRDTLAAVTTQIKQVDAAQAEVDAGILKRTTVMKEFARYAQEAYNIPDLKLDNDLLKKRNDLLASGMDENVINYNLRLHEIEEQRSHLLKIFPDFAKAANLTEEQRTKGLASLNEALNNAKIAEKDKNDETLRGVEIQKQLEYQREVKGLQGQISATGAGFKAGFIGAAGGAFEGQLQQGRTTAQALEIAKLTEQLTLAQTQAQALEGAVTSVGDAFANMLTTGVMSLIDGTATAKEVFVDFLKSIGSALMQAAQQMIAQYIAIGIARIFAGMGKAPGGGGGLPGFSMEGQLAGGGIFSGAGPFQFANGGIAPGGFKAFANGGVVNGPTLGLVGEGKYNEAIIPLPDGRSVPVKMQGEQSSRELLSSMAAQQKAPSLNLSFQTTTIGGVEYVSRDQLEQAMSETRRMAAKEGASRGASLALNRIANNPSDRRRAGIR